MGLMSFRAQSHCKAEQNKSRSFLSLFLRGRVYSRTTVNQLLEVCSCSLVYKPESTLVWREGEKGEIGFRPLLNVS